MKLAIMQPYFFPYIGYFQLINAVDKFVLYDDVNFINKGWINRNRILVNGKPQLFTMPLENASQNKLIKDINLVADNKWKFNLMKTIQFNYKKAPFYKEVCSLVENIVWNNEPNLSVYIFNSLQIICNYLNIFTAISPTSFHYNMAHLKASDKILNICLQEKSTHYFNPIGGIELYDKKIFRNNGIELFFLQPSFTEYFQFNNNFIPWLSIIDVMMFNSNEEIKNNMLTKFELI
jgi:hypothetical protein